MFKQVNSVRFQGFGGLITLLLLLVFSLAATTAPHPPTRIQPQLQTLVTEQPYKAVRVMVQKGSSARIAEVRVSLLGGKIVSELPIINAFVAELPAHAIPELAYAASVRWISLDAPVVGPSGLLRAAVAPEMPHRLLLPLILQGSNGVTTQEETLSRKGGGKGNGKGGKGNGKGGNDDGGGSTEMDPVNYFLDTLNVRQVWDMGLRGEGIAVAVIDSGIASGLDFTIDGVSCNDDLAARIIEQIPVNSDSNENDAYGHGTHVSGIIGGNGCRSNGLYSGIAPGVNLIALNISDGNGMAYESDTVAALQWVLDNKDVHNIRVVNLSINATVESSYHTSAMNAAAEILWFNGVVVVASAGNKGGKNGFNTVSAPPANDPFIITVGAALEEGTADPTDDGKAPFGASGTTSDGFAKPDIYAPGKDIISVLASNSTWDKDHPERVVANKYFRISGTSMAAPMVTGAVALLLQDEPNLTPDQVKYRLLNTSTNPFTEVKGKGNNQVTYTYPYLDIYAAVTGTTTESANTGLEASQMLWSGDEPINWNSVNWNSVNWNSVNWNSVNWNSVNWNSVNWNSVNWNSVNWNSVNWDE